MRGHPEVKEAARESKKREREEEAEEKKKKKEEEKAKKRRVRELLKVPEMPKEKEWFDTAIRAKIVIVSAEAQWLAQPDPSIAAEATRRVMADYRALEAKRLAMKELKQELQTNPAKLKAWLDTHPETMHTTEVSIEEVTDDPRHLNDVSTPPTVSPHVSSPSSPTLESID